MNQGRTKRKLTAIFIADVVGYSRLMETDETWTIQSLEENKSLISKFIEDYHGRVVDASGDNMLAEFGSVVNAVECAVLIQKELNRKNTKLLEDHRMHFRIGINLGDVVEEEGKLYGNGVNIAARIEGLAKPGGICISSTAYDHVKNKSDVAYDYIGEYQVKNIHEPVKVYRILLEGETADKYAPHDRSGKKTIPLGTAIIIAVLLLAALGSTFAVLYPKPPARLPVMYAAYELPEGRKFNDMAESILSISPDGGKFVYCTTDGLYLRYLNEWDAKLIAATADRPTNPVFSPDGKWIAYMSQKDRMLKKIAVNGKTPVLLSTANVFGALSWNRDNTIMYGDGNIIRRVSSDGGNPAPAYELNDFIMSPQRLPDGESILFSTQRQTRNVIMVHLPESGENKELLEGTSARYVKTGHIVYGLKSNIYAVPFDADTLEITGSPVGLVDNVTSDPAETIFQFAVSDSGTLIYVPKARNLKEKNNLVWLDRNGNEDFLGTEPDYYGSIQISPDGTKVAASIRDGSSYNIWVWNSNRGNWTQVTSDNTWIDYPLWTVDGEEVLYFSMRNGLCRKAADGTGSAVRVTNGILIPTSFSPNGDILALMNGGRSPLESAVLNMQENTGVIKLFKDNTIALFPKISPGGKWVAYMNLESGRQEIFVSPFPNTESGKWRISNNGGSLPLWSPDGRELFYREGDKVMAVRIEAGETVAYSKPEVLFERRYFDRFLDEPSNKQPFSWDIHPDGNRFLMIKSTGAEERGLQKEAPPKINIILNWFEELKEKVPVDGKSLFR